MKRKFKKYWLKLPPISTKRTTTSHLNSMNTKKKSTKYDVGKSRERHKNMEVLNQ
jgi:hypothetical protein